VCKKSISVGDSRIYVDYGKCTHGIFTFPKFSRFHEKCFLKYWMPYYQNGLDVRKGRDEK